MSIPDYQTIMLPLMRFAEDRKEHSLHELATFLAKAFLLAENELQELLPSGKQTIFINRVGWARTYLSKAGLLTPTKRGYFQISDRGIEVLRQNPVKIDNNTLKQFSEFNEFQKRKLEIRREKAFLLRLRILRRKQKLTSNLSAVT